MEIIKITLSFIAIISLVSCSNASRYEINDESKNPVNKYDGFVPDELTAKKIAEAIWLPIYGPSVLDERPYKAKIMKPYRF